MTVDSEHSGSSFGQLQPLGADGPTNRQEESPEEAKLRCEMELEFVQCLANPDYLHFLAQSGYLQQPAFINYLKYLLYWKRPEYVTLISYPMCLFFLDQLQDAQFRAALRARENVDYIRSRQVAHWYNYRNRDLVITQAPVGVGAPQPDSAAAAAAAAAATASAAAAAAASAMAPAPGAAPAGGHAMPAPTVFPNPPRGMGAPRTG